MDWAEKLPLDVLALIMRYLMQRQCGFCNRYYSMEVINEDMIAARNVNMYWRRAWGRMVLHLLRCDEDLVCFKPELCIKAAYIEDEKLPFIRVLHKN